MNANYKWTSRIPITISVDSWPVFDHLDGQLMTMEDKRDIAKDEVSIRWQLTICWLNVCMDLLRKVMIYCKMKLKEDLIVLRGWCVFGLFDEKRSKIQRWQESKRDCIPARAPPSAIDKTTAVPWHHDHWQMKPRWVCQIVLFNLLLSVERKK